VWTTKDVEDRADEFLIFQAREERREPTKEQVEGRRRGRPKRLLGRSKSLKKCVGREIRDVPHHLAITLRHELARRDFEGPGDRLGTVRGPDDHLKPTHGVAGLEGSVAPVLVRLEELLRLDTDDMLNTFNAIAVRCTLLHADDRRGRK
jgi:hypothetical protein